MSLVYFIHDHRLALIKIGSTGACPYTRLNQLRRSMTKSRLELLGAIAIQLEQNYYQRTAERELHTRFANLRDNGEWFRPGLELVNFVRENARPHFCSQRCPNGSSIEEEMRKKDEAASAAFSAAMKRT